MINLSSFFSILLLILFLSGCDNPQITQYDAPKDELPKVAEVKKESRPALVWSKYQGWDNQPTNQFRLASYRAPTIYGDVDVSIVKLSGTAGGFDANINRWAGQVGLPAISETVSYPLSDYKFNGLEAELVSLRGENQSILGARILYGGDSWFFKAMGRTKAVDKLRTTFDEWLLSIKPREND